MPIFNSLQSLLAQTPEVPAPEEIAQTWQQKLSALSSLSFQQFMEQAISAILHGAVKIAISTGCIFISESGSINQVSIILFPKHSYAVTSNCPCGPFYSA